MKTERIRLNALFILGLMLFATITFGLEPAPYIYYVKLGEFTEPEAAQARMASLQQLNMEPLRLLTVNNHLEIHFGEFPYYIDAYLYVQDLKNLGYVDADIVKQDNTEKKTSFPLVKGPRERVFQLTEANGTLTPCVLNMEDRDVVYIDNLLKTSSTEEVHAALLQKLAAREDTDPVKGWLSTRMAYIKLRMKDRPLAHQIFQQIAEGKIKATPELRVEAMNRVTHLLYAQKEWVRTYRAYKEMNELAQTPEQKASSLRSLSGLLVELARDEKKGNFEEARVFHEKALQEIPTNLMPYRATIELLHLESWYYGENYHKCIEEGEAYLQKYTDKPLLEIATCRLFVGMGYYKIGSYEDAVANLSQILDLPLGPKDRWKKIPDLKKHTLSWMIHIAKETGHEDDAKLWEETMNTLYPK